MPRHVVKKLPDMHLSLLKSFYSKRGEEAFKLWEKGSTSASNKACLLKSEKLLRLCTDYMFAEERCKV